MTIKTMLPHPLEDIVWRAFAECDSQDESSLSCFLAGATSVRGADKAYRKVALDVLGYMASQGKLHRDHSGWWRPETNVEKLKAINDAAALELQRRPKMLPFSTE